MKQSCHSLWILGSIALCSLSPFSPVLAQIVPDGTLPVNSIVTSEGSTTLITGGTVVGSNLFHSFEQFSIPTGNTVFFNNPLTIGNIISRVTSGAVSNIDGLIRANGTANLFLINPNGIIFGPNARLNIRGSFLASTASSLNFADGTLFSATAHPTTPLLTITVPIGLQFGEAAGPIVVQGPGNTLRLEPNTLDPNTLAFVRGENPVGLQVQAGKTLALVGGDVTLSGGNLIAQQGRVEVGSVAPVGLVSLTPIDKGWTLGYSGVPSFGDIQLSGRASVDASSVSAKSTQEVGSGDIQVQGRRVTVEDGSAIFALNSGSKPGGTLVVNASDSVELIGTAANGFPSALFTDTQGAGDAGNLTINTRALIVRDGAEVTADTFGTGKGGNVIVNASDSVELIGISEVNQLVSGLFTTGNTGAAGDLTINTRALIVQDGANASTSTSGSRNAGSLTVNASDFVKLIGTSAKGESTSALSTQTEGAGAAGDLTINTRALIVLDGAFISAATFDRGSGGTLTVNASDSVKLIGTSAFNSDQGSGLFTSVQEGATGAGGNLTVTTQRLIIQDGARITASSTSTASDAKGAGRINITAKTIRLDNQGVIAAETASGNGGDITLENLNLLLLRGGSRISTTAGTAEAGGDGGNITINASDGFIVADKDENSDITANAFQGQGGEVTINATGIFGISPLSRQDLERLRPFDLDPHQLPTNDITAISRTNPSLSGKVTINRPDVYPYQGLINLPIVPIYTEITQACQPDGSLAQSEFIITGRGGLPPNPKDILTPDAVQVDWVTLKPSSESRYNTSVTSTTTATPAPIVEATGWVLNAKGEVVLIANPPTVTPHSSWQTPIQCHGS